MKKLILSCLLLPVLSHAAMTSPQKLHFTNFSNTKMVMGIVEAPGFTWNSPNVIRRDDATNLYMTNPKQSFNYKIGFHMAVGDHYSKIWCVSPQGPWISSSKNEGEVFLILDRNGSTNKLQCELSFFNNK